MQNLTLKKHYSFSTVLNGKILKNITRISAMRSYQRG